MAVINNTHHTPHASLQSAVLLELALLIGHPFLAFIVPLGALVGNIAVTILSNERISVVFGEVGWQCSTTAMTVCGVMLVPNRKSFLLAMMGAFMTGVTWTATDVLMRPLGADFF